MSTFVPYYDIIHVTQPPITSLSSTNTASPSAKIYAANEFKAMVKKTHVEPQHVLPYFQALAHAITAREDVTLSSVCFSCFCHLFKRASIQDQTLLDDPEVVSVVTNLLIDRLSDPKPGLRATSNKVLHDFWLLNPQAVSVAMRQDAVTSPNHVTLVESLKWLDSVIDISPQFNFSAFVEPVVAMLALEDVRPNARDLLIMVYSTGDKRELSQCLRDSNVPSHVANSVLEALGMELTPKPQPSRPLRGHSREPSRDTSREPPTTAVPREAPTTAAAPASTPLQPKDNNSGVVEKKPSNTLFLQKLPGYPLAQDVVPEDVYSAHDLENKFGAMRTAFDDRESEKNWPGREKNVKQIRRLVRGNGPVDFPDVFQQSLKSNLDGVVKSATSLRTTLSNQGLMAIKESAQLLQTRMDIMVDYLLPQLIKLSAQVKKITSSNAHVTICALLANTSYSTKVVTQIMQACGEKNTNPRLYGSTWLRIIITCHSPRSKSTIENYGGLEMMDKCIVKGLADPIPAVKETMRVTYWDFAEIWPPQAASIYDKMDPKARNLLDKVRPGSAGGSAAAPATRRSISDPRPGSGLKDMIAARRRAQQGTTGGSGERSVSGGSTSSTTSTSAPSAGMPPPRRMGAPQRSKPGLMGRPLDAGRSADGLRSRTPSGEAAGRLGVRRDVSGGTRSRETSREPRDVARGGYSRDTSSSRTRVSAKEEKERREAKERQDAERDAKELQEKQKREFQAGVEAREAQEQKEREAQAAQAAHAAFLAQEKERLAKEEEEEEQRLQEERERHEQEKEQAAKDEARDQAARAQLREETAKEETETEIGAQAPSNQSDSMDVDHNGSQMDTSIQDSQPVALSSPPPTAIDIPSTPSAMEIEGDVSRYSPFAEIAKSPATQATSATSATGRSVSPTTSADRALDEAAHEHGYGNGYDQDVNMESEPLAPESPSNESRFKSLEPPTPVKQDQQSHANEDSNQMQTEKANRYSVDMEKSEVPSQSPVQTDHSPGVGAVANGTSESQSQSAESPDQLLNLLESQTDIGIPLLVNALHSKTGLPSTEDLSVTLLHLFNTLPGQSLRQLLADTSVYSSFTSYVPVELLVLCVILSEQDLQAAKNTQSVENSFSVASSLLMLSTRDEFPGGSRWESVSQEQLKVVCEICIDWIATLTTSQEGRTLLTGNKRYCDSLVDLLAGCIESCRYKFGDDVGDDLVKTINNLEEDQEADTVTVGHEHTPSVDKSQSRAFIEAPSPADSVVSLSELTQNLRVGSPALAEIPTPNNVFRTVRVRPSQLLKGYGAKENQNDVSWSKLELERLSRSQCQSSDSTESILEAMEQEKVSVSQLTVLATRVPSLEKIESVLEPTLKYLETSRPTSLTGQGLVVIKQLLLHHSDAIAEVTNQNAVFVCLGFVIENVEPRSLLAAAVEELAGDLMHVGNDESTLGMLLARPREGKTTYKTLLLNSVYSVVTKENLRSHQDAIMKLVACFIADSDPLIRRVTVGLVVRLIRIDPTVEPTVAAVMKSKMELVKYYLDKS